jgi:polyphosphate kinase 2 (PPK2 family)
MTDRFDSTLEAFTEALDHRGKKPLPTEFEALKRFIEGGQSAKDQAKEAAQDAEVAAALAGLQAQIEALQAQGRAPRAVVVYVDGPDGAGKSSTGAIVMRALEAAGYAPGSVSFKAPTAEERGQHWLQRFRDRGVPSGQMQAMFWDRGPAGDTVYAKRSYAEVSKMAGEVKKLEKELAEDGVLLFKLHLWAAPEKQAETFGKRYARREDAQQIAATLEKTGKLTPEIQASLDAIAGKIDGDDLRALVTFDDVQSKFTRFSKLIGAKILDATKRHPARLSVIESFGEALAKFAAAAKPDLKAA